MPGKSKSRKVPGHRLGPVHLPDIGIRALEQGAGPERKARFLAEVDFLPVADQPDNDRPVRLAFGEFDEVLRLGSCRDRGGLVDVGDPFPIVRALGLVEYDQSFSGNSAGIARVALHIVANRSNERFASSATGH